MRSTLNTIVSVQYSIDYTHNAVEQISLTYSSCIILTSCLLISNTLFFLSPQLLNF